VKQCIAIVGGSCVDIFATSTLPLIAYDSNPGTVNIGFGGVGRNIAENLARLHQDALLIAAFGNDPFSKQMLVYTSAAGVNTQHSLTARKTKAPFYISVNDSNGDMSVAISDMTICDLITPEFLSNKMSVINRCGAVILDTNIAEESIKYLAANCEPPLFVDTVSTRKASKLAAVLPYLSAVNTNRQEAEALLGVAVTADLPSLKEAANRFHSLGVSRVFITLGNEGAFLSDGYTAIMRSAFRVKTVNANGCGDAFSAAAFLMLLNDKPPDEILRTALAAAAVTAQSEQAVSPDLYVAVNNMLEMRNV
jgi:pseudouridine kinase